MLTYSPPLGHGLGILGIDWGLGGARVLGPVPCTSVVHRPVFPFVLSRECLRIRERVSKI